MCGLSQKRAPLAEVAFSFFRFQLKMSRLLFSADRNVIEEWLLSFVRTIISKTKNKKAYRQPIMGNCKLTASPA